MNKNTNISISHDKLRLVRLMEPNYKDLSRKQLYEVVISYPLSSFYFLTDGSVICKEYNMLTRDK